MQAAEGRQGSPLPQRARRAREPHGTRARTSRPKRPPEASTPPFRRAASRAISSTRA